MKKKLIAAKNFVDRHKVAIAVVGTAATATYLHIKMIDNVNKRLEEMGVDLDEFYRSDEDE